MNNEIIINNIQIDGLSNINENLSTHYLIYKITNLSTNQYYVGLHETNIPLDNYMGSGKYLLAALNKQGLSNFSKTILFDFDNFDDMNNKEKELVQLSNCYPYDLMSYNLKEGGSNGKLSELSRNKISKTRIELSVAKGKNNPMYGKDWRDGKTDIELSIHNMKISLSLSGNTFMLDCKENNPEKYKLWCENISKSHKGILSGENHPMFGKNPLENMTEEARKIRSEKISIGNKLALAKMTLDNYDRRTEKTRLTKANKTLKEKEIEHYNRHNATIGEKNGMYGKSLANILNKEEYNHWINALSLNNGMRGHSVTDFMTEDAAKKWLDRVSKIWQNMSKEKQDEVREKRRKAMTGKKWYHKIDNSIELLFNATDIIPNDFIKGRIPKTRKV